MSNLKSMLKNLLSTNEIIFISIFGLVFLFSFVGLYLFGAVPDEFRYSMNNNSIIDNVESLKDGKEGLTNLQNTNAEYDNSTIGLKPTRIVIANASVDYAVENPQSTNVNILDEALKRGAVRYPSSGTPDKGNMFIFGHSTSFKVVNNKAYEVFNNLKELKAGDDIKIITDKETFIYKVRTVDLVDSRKALVDLSTDRHMLTLSTCNSFGASSDRYVVEADFDHTETI